MSKVFSRLKKKKKNVKPNHLAIEFPRFFSTSSHNKPLLWEISLPERQSSKNSLHQILARRRLRVGLEVLW